MADRECNVVFYGLSTCGWCRRTKQWLDEHEIEYHLIYMDQLQGEEKEKHMKRMKQFVERQSFPLLVINDGERVIQGYHTDEFEEVLG